MPDPLTLSEAVRRLYDGEAAGFVATRKELAARAKAGGDTALARAIGALRKPTAAAAFLNHLPEHDVARLLRIGADLRSAQTRLAAEEMKHLHTERQSLLDSMLQPLAGSPLADDVRATLLAATADPSAGHALASRALVKPIHYSGWGEVDLSDALAHHDASLLEQATVRAAPTPPVARKTFVAARAAAQKDLARAERRLAAAEDAYASAKAARASARAAVQTSKARLAEAERNLEEH